MDTLSYASVYEKFLEPWIHERIHLEWNRCWSHGAEAT